MKTVIVGLGNPSYSDDGVGWLVARTIANRVMERGIRVIEASGSGLEILDIIADFEKAIIIDAVQTEGGEPGSIYRVDINKLSFLKEGTPHHVDCLTALNLGKKLGLPLPGEIILFGIEVQTIDKPNEGCTPRVSAAISLCAEQIMDEFKNGPVVSENLITRG